MSASISRVRALVIAGAPLTAEVMAHAIHRALAFPGKAEATRTLIASDCAAPEQTRVDSGEFTTPGRYQAPHAATILRCRSAIVHA